MNVFLIIMAIGGLFLSIRSRNISHRAASIAVVAYAMALLFWKSKSEMGVSWLLLYSPFFIYMIFVKWQLIFKRVIPSEK